MHPPHRKGGLTPAGAGDLVTAGLAHAGAPVRRQLEALLGPHAGVRLAFSVEDVYDALAHLPASRAVVLFVEAAQVIGPAAGFVRLARERSPHSRVLLLTAGEPEAELVEVLRHGAMGYLDPRARPDLVARAAHALHAGEAWVPRRAVARLLESLRAPAGAGVHAAQAGA